MKEMIKMELSEIEDKLNALNFEDSEAKKDKTSYANFLENPYLQAAAVLVFYNPETIKPVDKNPDFLIRRTSLINELIGCSELVIDASVQDSNLDRLNYLLKVEYRREALKSLVEANMLATAVKSNQLEIEEKITDLQDVFTKALENRLPPIQGMRLTQLTALQKVAEWLKDTGLETSSLEGLNSKITQTELFDTFRHMTGRFENGYFNEYFRGRVSELSTLRKYAGVAPPVGIHEKALRVYHNYVEPVFNWQSRPPFLLFGMGGVGKSTLLAKFLLDHAEAQEHERFPFVYLDFDRPLLDVLQPETLLVEAARQLAIQYYDDEPGAIFTEFYNRWKDRKLAASNDEDFTSISLSGVTTTNIIRENRISIVQEFASIMKEFSKLSSRPFLMVIDTFEEVQYRGKECVYDLYTYLQQLQAAYPSLRLVVSGRAKVTDIQTEDLELKELDVEAASGYLEKYGITDKQTIKNIISTVGGNPLSLKLAIDLVKKFGEEELSNIKITKRSLYFFRTRFPDMEIQGILYNRILGHIRNEQVRKLAHPGLILRLVSADLIYYVLNDACKLGLENVAQANDLFEELQKELSLVTMVDAYTVRHRPDVRKVMLGLIMKDQPKLVKQIHNDAIAYYSEFEDIPSRAEELYHRLSLDQEPDVIESRWLPGVENHLGSTIEELPSRAQAFIAGRTEIQLDASFIWDQKGFEFSEKRIVKRAVQFLNTGNGDKVLKLFSSLKENVDKSGLMQLIKVRAELQLNDVEQAKETILSALKLVETGRLDEKIVNELMNMKVDIDHGRYDEIPREEIDPPNRSSIRGNDEFTYDF